MFASAAAWRAIVAATTGSFHHRFVDGGLLKLNRGSGVVIALCGAGVLGAGVWRVVTGAA